MAELDTCDIPEPIDDAPIFIGFAWEGIGLPFPAGYLADDEEIRADARPYAGGPGFALTSVRLDDTVTLTTGAENTADLTAGYLRIDLVAVGGGEERPIKIVGDYILIPVKRLITEPST